jgi:UBA/TS-N domain
MAKVDELVAMGYSPKQAEHALAIAEGDLEQAVGFLIMEESGRLNFEGVDHAVVASSVAAAASSSPPPPLLRVPASGAVPTAVPLSATAPTMAFDGVVPIMPSSCPPTRASVTSAATKPGAYAVETDNVREITNMGYSRVMAQEALSFSGGDLDQALNYLLLVCRESVAPHGTSRTPWEAFQRSDSETAILDNDATMAARLQVEEISAARAAATAAVATNGGGGPRTTTSRRLAPTGPAIVSPPAPPESAMYHSTTIRNESDGPRMVSSRSFLDVDGAGPFCVCITASRFLEGGVVTAEFLNEILQAGTELFRKTSNTEMNVSRVLQKYGKSSIGIEADLTGGSPKAGVHLTCDHNHAMGLRTLLAECRNSQPAGWQALILEVGPSFEHICIGLPPKGSRNKFWYIDCRPRPCLGASGAHARVHSTLLQLTETLETMMTEPLRTSSRRHENFRIHVVKKVKT